MEAQGIEPWSEPASCTASTCVGRPSNLGSGAVTDRPTRSEPPKISPAALEDRGKPARLCYSVPPPRAGYETEGYLSELSSA